MNDKERKASKYLPFDALKGLKESISEVNKKISNKEFPTLSDEQKMAMDQVIFECYSYNKSICFSYYENGEFNQYSGVIDKIDVINKQIILLPKRRFFISRISEVSID